MSKKACLATVLVVLASLSGSPCRAALDLIQRSGGTWVTSAISGYDYAALCRDAVQGDWAYGARTGGGLDAIWYWGGWNVTSLNSNTYVALCPDATSQYVIYGARADGGIDCIWYAGAWYTAQIVSGTNRYVSMCPDPVSSLRIYCARSEGGMDIVWFSGGWNVQPLVGATVSYNQVVPDATWQYVTYAARGTGGGMDTTWYSGGWYTATLFPHSYSALAPDAYYGHALYGARNEGLLDQGYFSGAWYNYTLLNTAYSALATDATAPWRMFGSKAASGVDQIEYTGAWAASAVNSSKYAAMVPDPVTTQKFYGATVPAFGYATKSFTNLSGVSSISFWSRFHGYQSAVNRDWTGDSSPGGEAYDYSVHIIKDTALSNPYRMYWGARWRSSLGDGDHVCQVRSRAGDRDTWFMPHPERPEFWQAREVGDSNSWYSWNYMDPEVIKVGNTYYMFTQVEIPGGYPIDIPGQYAEAGSWADRIQCHTSTDGDNWTRASVARSVVINIEQPTRTALNHPELIYVPWDADGKPWWLYTHHIRWTSGTPSFLGHVRIRSSDPLTFDWNQRETVNFVLGQFGNQIAYINSATLGRIFVRISFVWNAAGRSVPSLEFSRDGLNWTAGNGGGVELAGSTDNGKNKNCYCLGISTINGTGELESIGGNSYKAVYGATTSGGSDQASVWYAEVGAGELQFTVNP